MKSKEEIYEHIHGVCECGERGVEDFNFICKDNPNCHYRQLHRYKQAIEEIKEIADDRSIYCENCSCDVEDFTCNDCGYVKIIQKCEEINGR